MNNTRSYYTYDTRDRLTGISHRYFNGSTETEQQAITYGPDNVGNPLTYQNNSIATNESWSSTLGYDWANRLTSENQTGPANASFSNVYAYDGNGNRTSVTRNGTVYTYSTPGANDQFLAGEGYSFTYNNSNGNPTTIYAPPFGGNLALTYDYENQLTYIGYPNGNSDSFTYNGDGLRVKTRHTFGRSFSQSLMVYDGSTVIQKLGETDAGFYTPGVNYVKGAAYQYFYRENGLGNTLQLVDLNGAITSRYEYDGYGTAYTLQENVLQPFKFAGKHGYHTDWYSGMDLLGHRYYLPTLGRFLTPDPNGHGAGLNLYAYCDDSPLRAVDPQGEIAWLVWGAGIGAVVDIGAQLYRNNWSFRNFSVGELLVSMGSGALSGGASTVIGNAGLGIARTALYNGVANGAIGALGRSFQNVIGGRRWSEGTGQAFAWGGAFGMGGSFVASKVGGYGLGELDPLQMSALQKSGYYRFLSGAVKRGPLDRSPLLPTLADVLGNTVSDLSGFVPSGQSSDQSIPTVAPPVPLPQESR